MINHFQIRNGKFIMDKFSKEKRSEIMQKIKSKETKVELIVFEELKKRKIYFKSHYSKIIGNPDIAFPRKKVAIFIDGDFWHGYKSKILGKNISPGYWENKIEKNFNRDIEINKLLDNIGWKVLRIWEHEIKKDLRESIKKIEEFIT